MYITLHNNRGRTRVDAADANWLRARGNWCLSSKGYAVRYIRDEQGQRGVEYMHRLILSRMDVTLPPRWTTDHINRDRLDNRRCNLRAATRYQQVANQSLRVDNTSGYRGVRWTTDCWSASITVRGTTYALGTFDDPYRASLIYDAAQRHFNGAFAGCNHPDTPTPPAVHAALEAILARYAASPTPYIAHQTSPYKGVSWDASAQKWRARTTLDGQRHSLGYFTDDAAAAAAIREARRTALNGAVLLGEADDI